MIAATEHRVEGKNYLDATSEQYVVALRKQLEERFPTRRIRRTELAQSPQLTPPCTTFSEQQDVTVRSERFNPNEFVSFEKLTLERTRNAVMMMVNLRKDWYYNPETGAIMLYAIESPSRGFKLTVRKNDNAVSCESYPLR